MRTHPKTPSKFQPLGFSLARLRSAAAIAAALLAAAPSSQAVVTWDGNSLPTPGDGFLWTDALNWSGDATPFSTDDVLFGNPLATVGLIQLGVSQTVNSLAFTEDYTLGAYGTNQVLTNTSGLVSVETGNFVTMNASYGGINGITLSGGGSLFMNHPLPLFGGNIIVDGTVAGTTLVHRQEGPAVQYAGLNAAAEFGRFDSVTLGYNTVTKTITLTNGGVYKVIGGGNNPEGGHKNIIIGAGGGTYDIASGFQLMNLDDLGQIGVTTETFTKAGRGRLTISGTMANGTAPVATPTVFTGGNPLGGIVNINGGMLDLSTQANTTVGANTYVRFSGIAATGSTVNINNGGTLMINSGTQATLDTPFINLNNGSILAVNGQEHIIGFATATAAGPTIVTVTGTSTFLIRDLFGVQSARLPRLRAQLDGTGTLELRGNTAAGGAPRLVVERATPGATFSGTFRLVENTSLELNPRFNLSAVGGTGTVVDTGKLLNGGDVEFAGWGSTLDVRDSNPAAASVLDYTNNEITITTTQNGALNFISPGRATAATGTGHLFNFGTLTMGSTRLGITGNNNYQTGLADTAIINGNAIIEMRTDNATLTFSNAAAISEDAAGRSLTLIKTGVGSAATIRDVIVGGAISISNLEVNTGNLALRGAGGAITTGFGGAAPTITLNGGATFANSNPTFGILSLDSNGTSLGVAGTPTVFAAANNNDRIADSATLNMRSNSVLKLISASGVGTTETIGTTNVSGHGLFEITKTGVAATPVILTLSTVNLTGTSPTANFTGTSLGLAGNDTTRIIIPGTPAGFMGAQFHAGANGTAGANGATAVGGGNEWAKYDPTVDGVSGIVFGVTPFVAADYTIGSAETTWAAGQQIKQNGATLPTLTANRNADRFNFQTTVTAQALNLAGFVLTAEQGGILSSAQTIGITDGATAAVPSGTAGITAGTTAAPAQLYVHANAQIDIRTPIRDNAAGGSVDFVKSGTGTVRLIHQDLGVGTGTAAINPFTTTPWASTLTGSWIVNDGQLVVHRGAFLGGRPVVLNGGHLELTQGVLNANADTIITGYGNNIIVNGNASVGGDDNAEAADANTGDRTAILLGSLTINNGSTLGISSFSEMDLAFMGGATINGRSVINTGIGRGNGNTSTIIKGVMSGSGFDMVGYNGSSALELGGTQTDMVNNTYNGNITVYAGTLRMNKANGFRAVTDGAAAEDIIINGGTLAWGTGQHGDLSTTNNINTINNGLLGITPMSFTAPFIAFQGAGQNQIEDTATITLLTGTLGEADRFNNEVIGNVIQKNGTLNAGLGSMEIITATISGGAVNMDRGANFKVGTLTLLPGAPDINITTGIAAPGLVTTMEIGAGGVSLSGQNIFIGTGSSTAVAGAGAVLRLLGNVTSNGSDLIGGSYGRKGIEIQTGSSFREIGTSRVDLGAGIRDFNIGEDSLFYITAPLTNGGLSKSGGGTLTLEPYLASTFAGAITVNAGVLSARADGAFGSSAGGVTVNVGGTVKIEGSWVFGDDFTLSGQGALVPGTTSVREPGALVNEMGTNRITGAVILAGNATIASNTFLDPSVVPGAGGAPYKIGNLILAGAGGVTGAGTLTLSGHGDGTIVNGINTGANGLIKDGAGRWTITGASSFTGQTTVTAGNLRITDGAALGGTATGTTVLGGALEVVGVTAMAEPLNLRGDGTSVQSGALVNVGGSSTLTGAITLGANATLRSDAGTLALGAGATITGSNFALTLTGNGNGSIAGNLVLGSIAVGDAVTKNGRGTWTLSGLGAFSGSTAVNAGTLSVASAGPAFHTLSPLNMGGGTVAIAPAAAAQTVGLLNLTGGGSTVNGGVPGLTVGNITRNPGATASFAGLVNAASAVNTNDILGGYATVGSDWARLDGSFNVVALTSYTDLASLTALPSDNSSMANFQLLSAPAARHTLKITSGNGLNVGANNLTLTGAGLMYTSSSLGGIGGTGTVEAATSGDELVVNVSGSGALDITAPLIGGGGGLTKTGSGTLVLSGSSGYSGAVNINGGTLSIVGPGGTTHPTALGTAAGPRNLNLNGGTFEVVGGDYDSGATTMYYVIGAAGGTVRSRLGSTIIINDGGGAAPGQLSGSGDLTFTGGGRYSLSGGTPTFPNFTGKVTVDGGILLVGNSTSLGGRGDQTITLKSGSALLNGAPTGLGINGLVNNLVIEGGVELYGSGGPRAFSGTVGFSGTNTIFLTDRDALASERQIVFNGRVSGTGVTLDVFGVVNNTPMYLADSSNDFTSANINLNSNAVLEARTPGSLGMATGGLTVNLNGANSRLLLRNYQNGDYHANVTVSNLAEISSDRLVNYAGGANQLLTINNLTVTAAAADKIVTLASANTYMTRVAGTASIGADIIVNATGNALFESGLTFVGGATRLEKRGAGTLILRGAADHTGPTLIQGGIIQLQNGGTLLGTSAIDLRGGELRIDNSEVVVANRVNDLAPITLGGGTLRITGAEAIGPMTAPVGNSSVFFNQTSETVAGTLTIPGLTRSLGATVNFGSDFGGAVGSATLGNSRVSSRIIIGGQVNVTGNSVMTGYFGVNNLDFVHYDGTTLDAFTGLSYGVRELRNPTPVNGPTYQADTAETAWDDADIVRVTSAKTLTANRALEALKVEAAVTIAMAAFNLRVETGGILTVGNAVTLSSTTGILTAGAGVVTAGTAELFLGGNNTLTLSAKVGDNTVSTQKVALVKMGAGTVTLSSALANTYTGGTYVNSGTLNLLVNNALGTVSATNKVFLNGGTLQFNIPSASSGVALGGLGHLVSVGANSLIIADNGALAGINNSLDFAGLEITGPYTLGARGFDSMDLTFTGTHAFTGTPTIDLAQSGSGSNPNTVGAESFVTLNGAITGSGFYVTSSGNSDNTQARLRIGGGAGDATNNTYVGKVIVLPGNFTEDTFVELNKGNVFNPTAITGDLEMNGGIVVYNFDNQIADTSNLLLNRGVVNLNGKSDTIASVTIRSGGVLTNPVTLVQPFNTLSITGDLEVTGYDDYGGVTTGFTVGNNSTVNVGGQIRIGTLGRVHMAEGQTGAVLNINGGLQMTGALLTQNTGAGASIIRLSSDVTTFASITPSRIGNVVDTDTFFELNGTRTFTVADGVAGMDLVVSTDIRDSTAPVAAGGLTKAGNGAMQLEGAANANTYSGPTAVNAGALVLNKTAGTNAVGNGAVTNTMTIGDGSGGASADQVILRLSNQIADATAVTVASSGLLDLSTFNASETIGDLTGAVGSAITLGPTSTLVAGAAASTVFAGSITGGGTVTKMGAGSLDLDGPLEVWTINANAGTLNFNTDGNYAVVNANATTNFFVDQTLTGLNIAAGVTVTFGDGLPFTGGPGKGAGASAVVPEPGSMGLLLVGALGLLGRRRRS